MFSVYTGYRSGEHCESYNYKKTGQLIKWNIVAKWINSYIEKGNSRQNNKWK